MKVLTNPVANLVEVFVAAAVLVWVVNEFNPSPNLAALALIAICVLGGISAARLEDR